jgi:hypothetical protein
MLTHLTAAGLLVLATTGAAIAEDWRKPLIDGFEGTGFAPEGGLYYRENFEQSAGRVEFQDDVVRTGVGALELRVVPLCAGAEGCSERAEIWEETDLRVPYDQGVWYGFAMRFADPIPQDDHRYLIAQWKREIGPGAEGDFSPFLALRMNDGHLFATVETNFFPAVSKGPAGVSVTCPAGQTPVWLRPETNQIRALVATDPDWTPTVDPRFTACSDKLSVTPRGGMLPRPSTDWVDYAILTRPGPDGTGEIEIFVDKVWVATITGHIGHGDKGLGENQYFKFGPYRDGADNDWTLYYDDFRRSPDCIDVLRDADLCAGVSAGTP